MKRPSKRAQANAERERERGRQAHHQGLPRIPPEFILPRGDWDSYGKYLLAFWFIGWDEVEMQERKESSAL